MMSQHKNTPQTVEAVLVASTSEVYILALSVRRLIFSLIPAPIEQLTPSAKMLGYGYDQTYAGRLCTLALYRSYIILLFTHGAALPDPMGLLRGTGKRARYVTIQRRNELDNPELRLLLEAAADISLFALKNTNL